MKAIVTGAAGFLGRYLVRQLVERGDTVRAVCRRPCPDLAQPNVEVVQVDLRDPQATLPICEGADVVFHAAGIAGIWGPWQKYYETNTLGTRHVLASCLAHSVKKLVYTSSPSVTFDGRDQQGVDESVPYPAKWLCHYPHTKALAEQEVLAANGRQGLATCALRPHLIWGPGDPHLVPRLIARSKAGRLRRIGAGDNLIDMVYVENAAAAHLQAAARLELGSPVAGRAYFISQGEPVTCWQWIDELLALGGLPPVRKSLSVSAAWRIGAVLEGIYSLLRLRGEPPMTRFLAAQLGRHHYYDITRARQGFGYEPRVSTAEGMQRLREWLQAAPSGDG